MDSKILQRLVVALLLAWAAPGQAGEEEMDMLQSFSRTLKDATQTNLPAEKKRLLGIKLKQLELQQQLWKSQESGVDAQNLGAASFATDSTSGSN